MSYELKGIVKELLLKPVSNNKGTFQLEEIKLIPDAEYTQKNGNTKKCLVIGDNDAKLLEYDQYVTITFISSIITFDQLGINTKLHLIFDTDGDLDINLKSEKSSFSLGPSKKVKLSKIGILA